MPAASPYPETYPEVAPATDEYEAAQLAGIRELQRIADLQQQAYAQRDQQ
ncbi:MAG TPA: hypothetical protein VHF26_03980 [Trebonia sp.]|nr:hypothetical protein [Trebonia sp.]